MTREEAKAYLADALDPDKAAGAIQYLSDGVEQLFGDYEAATAGLSERDEKITELRDTNNKLTAANLLLRTSDVQEQEEKEETVDELNARLREEHIKQFGG